MDSMKIKVLLAYKQGKISVGVLAEKLGLTISEAIDFLGSLGVSSPISYDDYLQGWETARKFSA